ncbi:hypothetical protein [Nocardioides dongkuii]|uniref:hypothetical protein n=1 Tax=Nocardioides dongkuii TaxID=2760089 RepID=UPI0015F85F7E|nr:hypothetical protein [Nocardioides dongkuii]
MTNRDENTTDESDATTGVPDEALPDDLVPADDNPLAEGLEPGESVDDLLTGGKQADQDGEQDADQDAAETSDTSQQD